MDKSRQKSKAWALRLASVALPMMLATGCAQTDVPDGRSVSIPSATPPITRFQGLNERRDPVTQVRLGADVLVPRRADQDPLPDDLVGPFELRGATLASALQLLMDDYDVTLAFESNLAMEARVSVSNLRGSLNDVVKNVCELAGLYCHFKGHVLTVRDAETFIVDLPPLPGMIGGGGEDEEDGGGGSSGSPFEQILSGLGAVLSGGSVATVTQSSASLQGTGGNTTVTTTGTSGAPVVDEVARVIIYTANQRQQRYAERYFDTLRKSTALIIYETHIWEVTLDNNNRTGIDWSLLWNKGNFGLNLVMPGGAPAGGGGATPISITPTYTGSSALTPTAVLQFISEQGAVKTISQPQLTVLSGARARLEVEQDENFVRNVSRTPSGVAGVADTVSTETDTVSTGLEITIDSAWDNSTVYGAINIEINDLLALEDFSPDINTTIQLPKLSRRNLQTHVRVRPGDAILIGGLVTQRDAQENSGPGFMKPLFSTAKSAEANNTELVFLMRPRVVAFVPGDEMDTPPIVEAPSQGAVSENVTPQSTSSWSPSSTHDVVTYDPNPYAPSLPGQAPPSTLIENRVPLIIEGAETSAWNNENTVIKLTPLPENTEGRDLLPSSWQQTPQVSGNGNGG